MPGWVKKGWHDVCLVGSVPSLLMALLLAAGPAEAQVPLAWEAPAECPDASDVRARTARLLEGSPRIEEAAEIRAQVRAIDAGLALTLRTEHGAREIRGDSCEVLADAAALIAAMAIDPEAVAAAELAADPPAPATEPAPSPRTKPLGTLLDVPVPVAPAARAATRAMPAPEDLAVSPSSDPARFTLGAGALLDLGVLPGASLAPGLSFGVELAALRLEARGSIFPSHETRLENHASAAGSVSLVGGELRGCAVALRGAVELAPCGGLALGAMHAEGSGVSSPGESTALWAAATGGAQIAVPLTDSLALRADLAALVALSRPSFVIDGIPGVVHRPAALAARFSLGAEVRFR